MGVGKGTERRREGNDTHLLSMCMCVAECRRFRVFWMQRCPDIAHMAAVFRGEDNAFSVTDVRLLCFACCDFVVGRVSSIGCEGYASRRCWKRRRVK